MAKLAEALSGQGSGADWGGAPFVQIDGSTDSFDRRLAVNCFRDDPSIQVALLSVTAAGATSSTSTLTTTVMPGICLDARPPATFDVAGRLNPA